MYVIINLGQVSLDVVRMEIRYLRYILGLLFLHVSLQHNNRFWYLK